MQIINDNVDEFIDFAKSILPDGKEENRINVWVVWNINNSVRFSLVKGYGDDIYMADIDNISIQSWNLERFKNQVQKVIKIRDIHASFIHISNDEEKQKILNFLIENDNISPEKCFDHYNDNVYRSIEPDSYRSYHFSKSGNMYCGRYFSIKPRSYDHFVYLFEKLTEIMDDENRTPMKVY